MLKTRKDVMQPEPIYTYRDYRMFLKDRFQQTKATNPVFSYRYFAKRAGYSSPNFLMLVIQGKRNLTEESIDRFSQALKLSARETKFFELLVNYAQAKDAERKQNYYQQLLAFPECARVRQLEKEQYEFLSTWYYPAILELVRLAEFQEDPNWIAGRLNHAVTPKQAREAIELLLKLKLLIRDEPGKLEISDQPITTGEEAQFLAAYSYHEQVIAHARVALTEQTPEEREFGGMTMALSLEQLNKVKGMIRDFRKLVIHYLSKPQGDPTGVYQFNLQLFRLDAKEKG